VRHLVIQNIPRASLSALAVVALLTAGCSSSSGAHSGSPAPTATGTTDSGGAAQVVMKALEFSPITVEAKVGQTVVWTNEDTSPHNVTYVSGPKFTSSPTLSPNAKFSIKLTEPGTIHYYCSIHPWMKATIVVSR
jgi:plastocyanin